MALYKNFEEYNKYIVRLYFTFNCLNIIQSLFTKRKLQLKREKEKENEILDISEKIIIKVEI